MKQKIILLLAGLLPLFIMAQKKITISGYIKDAVSKEALIGAPVASVTNKTGASSNQYGFFSFTVEAADTIEIVIS